MIYSYVSVDISHKLLHNRNTYCYKDKLFLNYFFYIVNSNDF